MRIGCLCCIYRYRYVQIGTKIYLSQGARKRTQEIAAKNILDKRQTVLFGLYVLPLATYSRILTIVGHAETDVPSRTSIITSIITSSDRPLFCFFHRCTVLPLPYPCPACRKTFCDTDCTNGVVFIVFQEER
jgi:hypothetical protein